MHAPSTVGRLLGDLEREVMTCVWKHGAETVRAVCDALPNKNAAYTTIMTIMNRLVEKGLLIRNEEKQSHVYTPRYSEAEFYRTVAGTMLDRIHKDFGAVAVACFVEEAEKLSKKKLRKVLRKM
ncbi:BlaI/MecI/CopY family transcriptional regulator [Candidatus Uhrbacteria bacterium]|nr:BlaI/MecI/CopY family transcriptional regulator [Candidatus Uhrbacteria bacterium]